MTACHAPHYLHIPQPDGTPGCSCNSKTEHSARARIADLETQLKEAHDELDELTETKEGDTLVGKVTLLYHNMCKAVERQMSRAEAAEAVVKQALELLRKERLWANEAPNAWKAELILSDAAKKFKQRNR